ADCTRVRPTKGSALTMSKSEHERRTAKLSKTDRKIFNYLIETIARDIMIKTDAANFNDVVARIWEWVDLGYVQIATEEDGEDLFYCWPVLTPEGEKAVASLGMH